MVATNACPLVPFAKNDGTPVAEDINTPLLVAVISDIGVFDPCPNKSVFIVAETL